MHAFVVTTPPPITSAVDTLEIIPETSVGIEEVRQIHHFLSRKPIQSPHNTVIIRQAELLTVPAQNALLKTLEDPPGGAQIYLVTSWVDQLLPTVLSRVQVISSPKSQAPNPKDVEKAKKLLNKLLAAKAGERLKLLDEQAFTRESALQFLDQLEYVIHEDLSLGSRIYNLVSQTRKYLKANSNVRLTMDNLVLNLPNTTPSVPSYAGGETYAGK